MAGLVPIFLGNYVVRINTHASVSIQYYSAINFRVFFQKLMIWHFIRYIANVTGSQAEKTDTITNGPYTPCSTSQLVLCESPYTIAWWDCNSKAWMAWIVRTSSTHKYNSANSPQVLGNLAHLQRLLTSPQHSKDASVPSTFFFWETLQHLSHFFKKHYNICNILKALQHLQPLQYFLRSLW